VTFYRIWKKQIALTVYFALLV